MFNPNNVSVTVVSARNLTGKGKNGKNDAFVVIQLAEMKFQTTIQKKAVAPFWEEECEFFYENKYGELVLTVYHRNLLGFDEFLGQIRLPLDEVCEAPKSLNPNQRPPNRWFPLKGKSGKNDEHKYRGELEIRLLFSRKQPAVADNQQFPGSKSPSVNSFTLGRQNSSDRQRSKDKTATLPPNGSGLKKKDFMGSMPSLIGSRKLSRPPSPTLSISSVSKKKSLFSKLKSSASFHLHQNQNQNQSQSQNRLGDRDSVGESISARNSGSGAPSPTFHGDGSVGGGRKSVLEPLSERQSQGLEDEQTNIFDDGISLEPDDPQPVIKIQKRGGGLFTLGGGGGGGVQKQRPVSAVIGNDRTTAVLPNRFAAASFDQNTGSNGTQATSGSIVNQSVSISNLPKDAGAVNVNTPKEDLISVINDQRSVINRQRGRIRELEDYIDQLLLRVMATQPELLQSASFEEANRKRAGSVPNSGKRNLFSFGTRK